MITDNKTNGREMPYALKKNEITRGYKDFFRVNPWLATVF